MTKTQRGGKLVEKILAIDVGGGTQDILLYEPHKPVENCVQLILPSQTVVVAEKITQATKAGQPIFLQGKLMGGGACVRAIKNHLKQGLAVYATVPAAKTIADDLEKVKALGVKLVSEPPSEGVPITMEDVDLKTLAALLKPYGVELPSVVAVAVQDHGECIGGSNRLFRFKIWQEFCEKGGGLKELLYQEVPAPFTRMAAAIEGLSRAYVMDTGAAAFWGALCAPVVKKHQEQGLVVLNIGNEHTVAALIKGQRIWGLFEHHTRLLTQEKLMAYVESLRRKTLTHGEIYEDGGHGAYIHPQTPDVSFDFVAVTGPRRALAADQGFYLAAPFGNMMLAGAFGLVAAVAAKNNLTMA